MHDNDNHSKERALKLMRQIAYDNDGSLPKPGTVNLIGINGPQKFHKRSFEPIEDEKDIQFMTEPEVYATYNNREERNKTSRPGSQQRDKKLVEMADMLKINIHRDKNLKSVGILEKYKSMSTLEKLRAQNSSRKQLVDNQYYCPYTQNKKFE